jgi:hypothetical protein
MVNQKKTTMTPQTTLDAVRELSERASLRPAPTRLRLTKPGEQPPGPRRAIIAYEDAHTPRIGGWSTPHSVTKRRVPKVHVTKAAMEKDWMASAFDKTEAKIARLPFVTPAGA